MLRRSLRTWRGWLRRTTSPQSSWGDLRALQPVDAHSGARRGTPVDRYFIERFLEENKADIHGHVLETGFDEYTRLFGGDAVAHSHVLHAGEGNRRATMIGDLASESLLAPESLDCIVLTQTLQYVFEVPAALANCRRALRKGGVLLMTVPVLSKISAEDMNATGEYWRFTGAAVRRLLSGAFGAENIEVRAWGNLVACTAFLHGIAAEELTAPELQLFDPEFEMLVAGRAVRP